MNKDELHVTDVTLAPEDPRKRKMITILQETRSVVTTACESMGISRQTHYRWMHEDPTYRVLVEDIAEQALDYAEHALHQLMASDDENIRLKAVMYFLRTKGRSRGYADRVDQKHSGELRIVVEEKVMS